MPDGDDDLPMAAVTGGKKKCIYHAKLDAVSLWEKESVDICVCVFQTRPGCTSTPDYIEMSSAVQAQGGLCAAAWCFSPSRSAREW